MIKTMAIPSISRIRVIGWVVLFPALIVMISSCQDKRGLVVGKIKKASKLATVEFTIDKIVYGVKRKRFLWAVKLNEAQFIAHSQAVIKTGINLERLKAEDVDIRNNRISLKLPHVEVLNFSYPSENFEQDTLISGDAFLNKINLGDQEEFFFNAELDIRNSIKFMDVVETTQTKTRVLIENMLRALGYQEIYIEFHEGELIPEIDNDLYE